MDVVSPGDRSWSPSGGGAAGQARRAPAGPPAAGARPGADRRGLPPRAKWG